MTSAYLFAMLAVTPSESREVALIANPEFEAGRVAGHRARRLIDGGNPAFSDPFLVMAEDWVPRDAFSRHPHRGIETVTLVLDGALEVKSAKYSEVGVTPESNRCSRARVQAT
jgi:redox-sensitive bicupin YhaK (pirin superfamily)